MKIRIYTFFLFIIALLTVSCSKVYYVGETTEPITIYASASASSRIVATIPIAEKILIKKRSRTYPYIVYQTYEGYINSPTLSNYHKFKSSVDGTLYGYSTEKSNSYTSSKSSTKSSSTGGTVHVRGYYRKNGTYVKPYTRSAPTRH